MITSLRLKDFKNFADETLHAGPFTLIVGANASGKSNIRDAFRFLHGIGRGYWLAEIVGGKHGADWQPIRGSVSGIARLGAPRFGKDFAPFTLEAGMRLDLTTSIFRGPLRDATYFIEVGPDTDFRHGLSVVSESLRVEENELYSENVFEITDTALTIAQPVLSQLDPWMMNSITKPQRDVEFDQTKAVRQAFNHMRFFDPTPDRMRAPGLPGQHRVGEGGENLSAALQEICVDPKRKSVLIDWVCELTPMDVADFEFCPDPLGNTYFFIHQRRGSKIPAAALSDGTLRFLPLLAALLGWGPHGLYFFENIERGLHPSRLHLLVDLIERQTAKGWIQVIATTHSPELLSLVNDETFENVAVTCRLEDTSDAIIRRVADLHNARKLRSSQGLERLLAGGWMENALAFTEEDDKDDGE